MEDRAFDRLARQFGGSLDRRTGIKGLLAGLTGILGISAAEARIPVPPLCRSTGMECSDNVPCCSGRCIVKSDGTSRCARKTSNRKKKKEEKDDKGGGGGDTCIAMGYGCWIWDPVGPGPVPCCDSWCGFNTNYDSYGGPGACRTCLSLDSYGCDYENNEGCCSTLHCEIASGPSIVLAGLGVCQ